jgi:hypothetical protein
MASPFQRQALARKWVYIGLIVGLFTVSLLFREYVLLPQANRLGMREEARGQVELTSSAVKLMLTGSRGAATCFLWVAAMDKMKRNEWNELELIVRSVSKLQPHFVTPWLFQSWNLAFNVAVECDSPHDKYFYISRGIELLAEGEQLNQGSRNPESELRFPGNPDLRFNMGFYYQLKIGQSDEHRTLTSLLQMSCIKPGERDPDELKDMAKFEAFCRKHPRLVRRLREQLNCGTPKEVLDFLRDHRELPHRYREDNPDKLKPRLEQFPILPPTEFKYKWAQATPEQILEDDFTPYHASRAWYAYAQEPLPPPDPDFNIDDLPVDRSKYRMPKMSHYIFRQYPARAQEYIADDYQEEGWFDEDGWEITGRPGKEWFKDGSGRERVVVVGDKNPLITAQSAWALAYEMYKDYGTTTRMLMPYVTRDEDPVLYKEYHRLKDMARAFRQFAEDNPVEDPEDLTPAHKSEQTQEGLRAFRVLTVIGRYATLTNIDNHYTKTDGERKDETVRARKLYFEAEKQWKEGKFQQAIDNYRRWIQDWERLLIKYPTFRANVSVQEESYERQIRYLARYRRHYENDFKRFMPPLCEAGLQATGIGGALAAGPVQSLPWLYLTVAPKRKAERAGVAPAAVTLGASPLGTGPLAAASGLAAGNLLGRHRPLSSLLKGDQPDRIIRVYDVRGPFDGSLEVLPGWGPSVVGLAGSPLGTGPVAATAQLTAGKKISFFNPEMIDQFRKSKMRPPEAPRPPAGEGPPRPLPTPEGPGQMPRPRPER